MLKGGRAASKKKRRTGKAKRQPVMARLPPRPVYISVSSAQQRNKIILNCRTCNNNSGSVFHAAYIVVLVLSIYYFSNNLQAI